VVHCLLLMAKWVAVCCSMLQGRMCCTALHYISVHGVGQYIVLCGTLLLCVAVQGVSQCTVCSSVLQRVAVTPPLHLT